MLATNTGDRGEGIGCQTAAPGDSRSGSRRLVPVLGRRSDKRRRPVGFRNVARRDSARQIAMKADIAGSELRQARSGAEMGRILSGKLVLVRPASQGRPIQSESVTLLTHFSWYLLNFQGFPQL